MTTQNHVRETPLLKVVFYYSLFSLLFNYPAVAYLYKLIPFTIGNFFFLLSFCCVLFAFGFIIYNILMSPRTFKFWGILFVLLNATAMFFISQYKTIIDKNTLLNVIGTDRGEVKDLIGFQFIGMQLLMVAFPIRIVWKTKIESITFLNIIKHKVKWTLAALILAIVNILVFYKDYSIFYRSHREIKHIIIPINYLDASKVFFKLESEKNVTLSPLLPDAHLDSFWSEQKNKHLIVLIVGETARLSNFSIYGYERETTPLLKKQELFKFTDTSSCGTSTAVSVPCIFSHAGRSEFDVYKYKQKENILDVFKRLGFRVIWLDNNSGCSGVCERIESHDTKSHYDNKKCKSGYCFDEDLVDQFKKTVESLTDDKVLIVMHQIGSHGPSYYHRYPDQFEKFKPSCKVPEVISCTHDELMNAYDNTILYTDFNLSNSIDVLKAATNYNSAMIYVSDHGESLGEGNIYLHGLPYWIAPKVQTSVPMFMWFSSSFKESLGIDEKCLTQKLNLAHSHDNISHSLLSLGHIQSDNISPSLNIFNDCLKKYR